MHVTVTTGVAGTPAQPLTATFPTPQAALAEQERLVKERQSWGYVELEPALQAPEPEEPAPSPVLSPAVPPPAPVAEQRPDRAERAARAATALKSNPAKPRRSGPSKKLMGLPPQALALTV